MVLALLFFVLFSKDLFFVSILLGDLTTTLGFILRFLLLLFWPIFSSSLMNGFICLFFIAFFGLSAIFGELVFILFSFIVFSGEIFNFSKSIKGLPKGNRIEKLFLFVCFFLCFY